MPPRRCGLVRVGRSGLLVKVCVLGTPTASRVEVPRLRPRLGPDVGGFRFAEDTQRSHFSDGRPRVASLRELNCRTELSTFGASLTSAHEVRDGSFRPYMRGLPRTRTRQIGRSGDVAVRERQDRMPRSSSRAPTGARPSEKTGGVVRYRTTPPEISAPPNCQPPWSGPAPVLERRSEGAQRLSEGVKNRG